MSRAPQHIIADIGHKLAADITGAAYRNIALVDDVADRFVVTTFGASAAIAMASGALMAMVDAEKLTPERAADELWNTLRPMVVGAIGGIAISSPSHTQEGENP